MTSDTAQAPQSVLLSAPPSALPSAPPSALGIGVPAGLFAPTRRPVFALLDAIGEPAHVDSTWLEDCAGETVYLAAADAAAFRDYLRSTCATS